MLVRLGLTTLLAALMAAPAMAQAQGPLVTVTVTAVEHKGGDAASVTKEDVQVRQRDQRRPVVDWTPAQSEKAPLDLVILIDDSLDTGVGTNLDDLKKFIRSLPANTRVAVAYAQNSSANLRQNLTSDREEAAKALRLPLGQRDSFQSPYLAVVDLLGRLPETKGPSSSAAGLRTSRRAVLLISDGIDLMRGVSGSSPASNNELQRAIEQAQRRNVQVYALYASGSGRIRRNFFLVSNGQGALSRLALETGGEAYFQGFGTPVSFQPFLEDLNQALSQQYLLTFRAQPGEKAGYQRVRITTEVPGVELMAPTRVWVPAR
ncbi:MAG: VWA domain-containing protein [Candidatus Acidiferrales bacterium]